MKKQTKYLLSLLLLLPFQYFNQLTREDRKLNKTALFNKFEEKMKKSGFWKKWTANERKFRFDIFLKNLNVIEKVVPPPLGKDGRPLLGSVAASYRKGINKFAFLTNKEFKERYLIQKRVLYADTFAQSLRDSSSNVFGSPTKKVTKKSDKDLDFIGDLDEELDSFEDTTHELDSEFDDLNSFLKSSERILVENNIINPRGRILQSKNSPLSRILQETYIPGVKPQISWEHLFNPIFDQKDCNSCYAAASLDAIEAIYKKTFPMHSPIHLSVQEIMDCSTENSHCLGGQPSTVLQYVKDHGVAYSKEYPYEHKKKLCRAKYYLNKVKPTSGPRILEALLNADSGRILQYTRFASDPRLNNYQRNFVNTYQRPVSATTPFNLANQGFNTRNNGYDPRFQNNRNQGYNPRGQNNSFQSNYAVNRNQYNPNQQFWNQNTNVYNNQNVSNLPRNTTSQQMKLDGPRGAYYYEIVSYPNGMKRVEYRDLNGLPYVPSFVKKEVPVVDPNPDQSEKSDDSLQPLEEEEDKKEEEKEKEEETTPNQTSNKNPDHLRGRFEKLKGFYFIKQNVIDLLKALQHGPVVTAHYVSEAFKFYESGVFNGDGCENGSLRFVNHASVIVGYDLTDNIPYFKLRNSWADDWGEKGYYRMKIGDLTKMNNGICLMAGTPFMVFPYLDK
jgi:hypothetical protein